MCALAEVLATRGLTITGSDMQQGDTVSHLLSVGIAVSIGHEATHVIGADCVIRTAAAHDDNVEVAEARRLGIPVFERAQAWGYIMRDHANALCLAGTHGKTTATSMAAHITIEAGLDPTVMIGGTLPLIGAGHRVGAGPLIVMEACEYCNSFLNFSPTVAVILNIEEDHLDCFKDLDEIVDSFTQFALKVPEDSGHVLLCVDDEGAMRLKCLPRNILTFGLSPEADVRPDGLRFEQGYGRFTVAVQGRPYAEVKLSVPGRHNVINALGAAAAAWCLRINGEAVTRGLSAFSGAKRRFERVGYCSGALIVDDYAHHPTEIAATLKTARTMGFDRIICVFQPHTFTRTAALFDDFVLALREADLVLFSEIYAAREQNTTGLSAASLAEALPGALFFPDMDDIVAHLRTIAREGDLILTMGAGNIGSVGRKLVSVP